jgi:hypothetical protein
MDRFAGFVEVLTSTSYLEHKIETKGEELAPTPNHLKRKIFSRLYSE